MAIRILISTGIHPPKVGGPAQYSKNLKESLEKKGHSVSIATYTIEDKLPMGVRHIIYFLKVFPKVLFSDASISLDTFSVALPTVLAAKLLGKKSLIRTGGDFLWEQYVERCKKKVLLRDFYRTEMGDLNTKEKMIFRLTRWVLRNTTHVIFSTEWQRRIFIEAYDLNEAKTSVVENYYGPKEGDLEPEGKTFIASSRGIFLKNEEVLKDVFADISGAELFVDQLLFDQFMRKIARSYAVIAPALSEISSNLVLDAIRYNRPFICTREIGTYDRIQNAGIFVDPLNKEEIKNAILKLLTEEGYAQAKEKVRSFNFVHTWDNIVDKFLNTINTI